MVISLVQPEDSFIFSRLRGVTYADTRTLGTFVHSVRFIFSGDATHSTLEAGVQSSRAHKSVLSAVLPLAVVTRRSFFFFFTELHEQAMVYRYYFEAFRLNSQATCIYI